MQRQPLRIVHITDVQLGFSDSRNRHRKAAELGVPEQSLPLQYTHTDQEHYRAAIERINALDPAPDVVINTGDLVDQAGDLRQWKDYAELTSLLDSPVRVAIGNHDIGAMAPALDDFYSFMVDDLTVVVLNSVLLKDPGLDPERVSLQRDFLPAALQAAPGHIWLVMHHPLFFESPTEPEGYFTLPVSSRRWVLEQIEQYPVTMVLSGHHHRNSQVTFAGAELITTGSVSEPLGNDSDGRPARRGFRILDFDPETGRTHHQFVGL